MLSTLKINLTLNMQNIQHIFDIEVKSDIEHPCVFDIEVKPDIEHAANISQLQRSKYVEKNYHMLNIGGVER
jgi:allophanate hydrolase subunit 1